MEMLQEGPRKNAVTTRLLISTHFHFENLARFALGEDFEGAAADLAIAGKSLDRDARVDSQFKTLPAKGALNAF